MKRSLIIFFLGFGLGLVITYLVSTYLEFGEIPSIYLQGISFGTVSGLAFSGIGLIRDFQKSGKEARKKHAKDIGTAMKIWIKSIKWGNIEIGAGKVLTREPKEPKSRFSGQIMEHLKSPEYKSDIWQLWENYKELHENERRRIVTLWNDFKRTIVEKLTKECPILESYDGTGNRPSKYYHLPRILRRLIVEIEIFTKKGKIQGYFMYPADVDERTLMWEGTTVARSNLKRDLKLLSYTLEKIIREPEFQKIVKSLQIKDFSKQREKFEERINEIVENLELGVPLKGKCIALGY